MASGFIVNIETKALASSEFRATKLAELRTGATSDARSKALPNAASLSQLDVRMNPHAAGVTYDMFISWDSAGAEPVSSTVETVSLTMVPGSSTIGHTTVSLDKLFLGAPTPQTATGEVYLWVKPSSDNVTLNMARIHWHDDT
tara:strand:- start:376 stop:804 length:429 start_codon:yes stop_codon:yes gene_type:complete